MTSTFVSGDARISHSIDHPINSCDGTYQENCDSSRDYDISQVCNSSDIFSEAGSSDFVQLLTDQGATSTLDYMRQYWLNDNGDNEELWNVHRVSAIWTSR